MPVRNEPDMPTSVWPGKARKVCGTTSTWEAYKPFAPTTDSRQPSDTLVTKVLLGTLGCLPACDRYFIAGFKSAGFSFSSLNANSVARILQFCHGNLAALRVEQARIEKVGGIRYPLMKLVDMYFWQLGYDRANSDPHP
jgi:hypothetical protein